MAIHRDLLHCFEKARVKLVYQAKKQRCADEIITLVYSITDRQRHGHIITSAIVKKVLFVRVRFGAI